MLYRTGLAKCKPQLIYTISCFCRANPTKWVVKADLSFLSIIKIKSNPNFGKSLICTWDAKCTRHFGPLNHTVHQSFYLKIRFRFDLFLLIQSITWVTQNPFWSNEVHTEHTYQTIIRNILIYEHFYSIHSFFPVIASGS